MKRKNLVILTAVVLVCASGMFLSRFLNWSVDPEQLSGDIAKSARFSHQSATESPTNLEELFVNDEEFRDGFMASSKVMRGRAARLGALIDLSREAAGGIADFDALLGEMDQARGTVDLVIAALDLALDDMEATLGGDPRPDLALHSTEASLAFAGLQKQNALADRFVETADRYLAAHPNDARLRATRDQWEEYRQQTAAAENKLN